MPSPDHWDRVWARRSPDEVSWYQPDPTRSLRLITEIQPDRDGPIIDVGGGASTLVDALLEEGYTDLTVLDIAEAGLAHVRDRIGADDDRVSWVVADVTTHVFERRFACWHDRAVFHFLIDDEARRRYVERMQDAVAVAGHAIVATFALDGPESCSGLPVRRHGPDDLRRILAPGFAPVSFEREVHHTPAGGEQPFTYGVFRRDA